MGSASAIGQPVVPRSTVGRPALTAAQIADRRRSVTEAARALFVNEGYSAVSIRRVAAVAGVTPKTLYSYFESKLALLLSLWSDVFMDVFTVLERISRDEQEPTRLVKTCQAYVRYWVDRPDCYRLVFMSGDVTQTAVTGFIDRSGITEMFSSLAEPLVLLLEKDGKPGREAAELLICALQGIVHCQVTMSGYPWAPPETLVEMLVRSIASATPTRTQRDTR